MCEHVCKIYLNINGHEHAFVRKKFPKEACQNGLEDIRRKMIVWSRLTYRDLEKCNSAKDPLTFLRIMARENMRNRSQVNYQIPTVTRTPVRGCRLFTPPRRPRPPRRFVRAIRTYRRRTRPTPRRTTWLSIIRRQRIFAQVAHVLRHFCGISRDKRGSTVGANVVRTRRVRARRVCFRTVSSATTFSDSRLRTPARTFRPRANRK